MCFSSVSAHFICISGNSTIWRGERHREESLTLNVQSYWLSTRGRSAINAFTEELMCLVHVRTCPASFSMERGPESPFLFSEWPDTNTDETEVGNLKYAAVEMIWDLFALVLAAVREKAQVSALWHFPVNPRGFLNGECSVRNWRILRRRTKNEAFSPSVTKTKTKK